MPFVQITRATLLSGKAAEPGEVYEMDDATAKQTVICNKGVIVKAPAEAVVEPPKPKVKKVSAAPAAS